MANEIAQLGFEIDTAALIGASKAADATAASLDKMGRTAEVAGAKTKKAGEDINAASRNAGAAGASVRQLQDMLRQVQGQAANSGQAIEMLSQKFGFLAQSLGQGGAGGLTGALSSSAGGLGRLAGILGPVGGAIAGLTGGVLALGGAYVGLNAALAATVDRYALLEGRLKNVYGSASAAREVFAQLTDLASKNALSVDQTAESYLRLARNNQAIGLTRDQMLKLTDAVQMLGRVSGASNGELAGAMMQFSQALAAGRLNGDELRSIMESMPALVKAIADGMGVSVGQIRAMGAAGELTGDKITQSILGQLPKIQKEFEGLPQTTEQAFTRVGNAWDKLLVNMGRQLDSSGFMQSIYNATAGLIELMGNAVAPETLVEERTRLQGENRNSYVSGPFGSIGRRNNAPNNARIGEINRQLFRDSLSTMEGLTKERMEQVMAPATRAEAIIKELDKVGTRTKELEAQRKALEETLQLYERVPGLFVGKEAQMQMLPGLIAQINKELRSALPELDKFIKGVTDRAADMGQYGSVSFGADVRKLAGTMGSNGSPVSAESAASAVAAERTQNLREQTAQLQQQIEIERTRTAGIGRGREAEIAAEAQSKRLALQYQLFGKVLTTEAIRALDEYQAALETQMRAEDRAAGAKALHNAQLDLAIQKQLDAAAATGMNVGALRELERQLQRNKELETASPEQRAAIAAQGQASDLAAARAERQRLADLNRQTGLQGRLAAGMSPADARRMQQEADARQFAEGFSPAQQEAAYQAKLNELRTKDAATIRQQLDDKVRAAELAQREIELTKQGGLAAQVAIARERELNSIKAAGLNLTQEEVDLRLKLAEQAVLDADALSKAQRTANAYVEVWNQAGQSVASGLERQFEGMLNGQKADLKDFLESVAKDIAMAVIRAQITQPIANMFSDAGSGSLGGGGGGGIAGAIGSAIAGAFRSGGAPAAANSNTRASGMPPYAGAAVSALSASGGGSFETVGNFNRRGAHLVDGRLVDILKTAADRSGFDVRAFSGYRPGDPRFHGRGLATDVSILGADGKALPNYQDASAFREYELFAQQARLVQMEKYPELAKQFRWGGYFGGPKGKYGAMDLMHFDLGGSDRLGMSGGSWEGGLTSAQRRLFAGADSRGIGDLIKRWADSLKGAEEPLQKLVPAMSDMTKNASQAAPAVGELSSGLGDLLSSILKSLFGMFGGGGGGIYGSGGVIAGGHAVTLYGTGGLVSKPTLFPMARGAGLMGEAGAEAILPLKRGPDGKLGVGGTGGGGSDGGVSVVINDMRSGGEQVEQQEGRGPDGKRMIRLTIRDEVKSQMKNGVYDPEMSSQYGARRVLARR